jgi:hypothetical protein
MYQALLAFTLLVQMFCSVTYFPQSTPGKRYKNRGWRAATYRGLTIGKSGRADMLRVLGKPHSSVPSADQEPPYPIIWNDYGMIDGALSGRLAVEVDSRNNQIVGISISPENMSKEDAIKYFGNDYVAMDYEFCEGISEDEEVGPVYENPKSGNISYIEYRSRGIAIHLNYMGKVNAIYFVNKPIGLASKADCKREVAKMRKKGKRR